MLEYQTYGYIVVDKYKDPWTVDGKRRCNFSNRINNIKIFVDKWRALKVANETGAIVVPILMTVQEDHTMDSWEEEKFTIE